MKPDFALTGLTGCFSSQLSYVFRTLMLSVAVLRSPFFFGTDFYGSYCGFILCGGTRLFEDRKAGYCSRPCLFQECFDVSQRSLTERMSKILGFYEVIVISGEWDIVVKVRAGSVEEIGTRVVDKLRMLKGIEKMHTCVAVPTIKESF
jgi:hypothetical protein